MMIIARQARRGLVRSEARLFSSMPPQDEGEQGSLKSTLGGMVFEGIQGTLKAAQDMKEFLYPEDL